MALMIISRTKFKSAIKLLKAVRMVREYQQKPSIANQGQCLDGFSALANYDSIADKIKIFLDSISKTKEEVPNGTK